MNNLSVSLIAILLFTAFTSSAQKRILSEAELPSPIKSYINKHFKDHKIIKSSEKKKTTYSEYEIKLSDGVELEFEDEKIVEVKSISVLPETVIPSEILTYVKQNYPDKEIRKWELDSRKQEVKLSNGIELEFDLNGTFLKID